MDGALGASELCEPLHDVFLEGVNIDEIWARLQQGGIFQKSRCFVIFNDGIHFSRDGGDRTHKRGQSIYCLSELLVSLLMVMY